LVDEKLLDLLLERGGVAARVTHDLSRRLVEQQRVEQVLRPGSDAAFGAAPTMGQFIGAEAICPGGDDQFAEPKHLAALEVARLVLKRFQFPVEIPRLTHDVLQQY